MNPILVQSAFGIVSIVAKIVNYKQKTTNLLAGGFIVGRNVFI